MEGKIVEAKPLVAEIVGPAGAGKTTLLRALSERTERIRPSVCLPRTAFLSALISNAMTLAPAFLRHYRQDRWFTWRETRSMVYLKGWHQILMRYGLDNELVTVLDHGAIYRLALLREFGPEVTKSHTYISWWTNMLNQWAATLGVVIWLDAPDAILIERVNSRSIDHRIKGQTEQDVRQFFFRYRRCYEEVIARMTASCGPDLLRIETDRTSLDEIVDRSLTALHLKASCR